jgi:hypothetical protein
MIWAPHIKADAILDRATAFPHQSTMIFALLAAVPAVAGYAWPNPRMDALESLRYDQGGPAGSILSAFVIPCNQFIHDGAGPSGRTNAADWLRTVCSVLPLWPSSPAYLWHRRIMIWQRTIMRRELEGWMLASSSLLNSSARRCRSICQTRGEI